MVEKVLLWMGEISQVTAKAQGSSGDVFQDLGFDTEEAAHLRLRATLMSRVRRLIKERGLTQAEAARIFGVTQPRISDLVRGKIDLFSIDSLVDMLARARYRVSLVVREDRRVA